MRKTTFIAAGLGMLASSALALTGWAAVDGSKEVICSTAEILECAPFDGCARVDPRDAGIPRFLKVDFAGKKVDFAGKTVTRVQPGGGEVASQIEHSKVLEGRMVLQGAAEGYEGTRDGIAWSLSVDQESDEMILSGSGVDAGFVVFGACTPF